MSLSDPIADFLTRLRNSANSSKTEVMAPYSKIKAEIARILKQEGYITNYEIDTTGKFPQIKVVPKLVNRASAITGLKRISKPGLRVYARKTDIPRVLGGLGIVIVSTSQGIMTGQQAKQAQLGGEVLAYVW